MTLNSGRDRRACDQRAIVIKRELLVRDGDDDLEWPLRRVLRSSLLRQFRLCVPVVVLVPETERVHPTETCSGTKKRTERVRWLKEVSTQQVLPVRARG